MDEQREQISRGAPHAPRTTWRLQQAAAEAEA